MWKLGLGLHSWACGKNDMGIHSYDVDIDTILDFACEQKFEGLEITNLSINPYPEDLRDTHEIKKYKERFSKRNLKVAGVQAAAPRLGASSNEEERLIFAQKVVDNIVFAKEIGADYLGVWPGEKQADVNDWIVVDRLLDSFNKIFKILKREKIELGDLIIVEEAEPVECFSNLTIAETVIKSLENPNFKFLFDTAHINFMENGNYINALKQFKDIVGVIHLADNDGTRWNSHIPGGMSSKHLIIGEGDINFMRLFQTLEDINYRGWIQMDCWQNKDPMTCSRINKKVVDSIIKDISEGLE